VAELEKQNAELKAENDKLKAEIEQLKKRIAELEKLVEEQKARIAELEKKIEELNKELAELRKLEPERVEDLKKQIEELKKEIARLKQQIEDLNAQVAALQDENARLRARNAELEQQVAQLNALVVPLQQENAQQKARIAELEALLAQLRQDNARLQAEPVLAGAGQSADCKNFSISAFSVGMTSNGQEYVLNISDGFGIAFTAVQYGGRYVATTIASGLRPDRYLLVMLSRKEEERDDEPRGGLSHRADDEDQPNGGGGRQSDGEGESSEPEQLSPLQPPAKSCAAIVTMIFSAANSGKTRRYKVDFDPGRPAKYFGDLTIRGDWDAAFSDPSPEGEAWLKDQLAHADIVPAEAAQPASGAGGAPQGIPPERLQRAAPDRERPRPGFPGERRRGAP
jgi:cell division protein FtsB